MFSRYSIGWDKVKTPYYVRKWIDEGVSIPFTVLPSPVDLPNYSLSHEEELFVDNKIKELLSRSCVSRVDIKPVCVSPIGCTKKKGADKYRLITDMRYVNNYIEVPKTRYEDLSTLPEVVQNYDYFATVDLKDGFHHVSIKNEYRKFFGFKWKGLYYQWNVLNFGCTISPYFFTKILRPVVQYFRECGVRCLLYVDDFLICSKANDISVDIEKVVHILTELGWSINTDKSNLTPCDTVEYLGLIISTSNEGIPVLRVPNSKICKVRKDIKRILKQKTVSARVLSKVAGQCNFICKTVLPGRLKLRNVYRLIKTKEVWESQLELDEGARNDLLW